MSDSSNPAYMSVAAAAEHLDLTERTIRGYIAASLIPAYRVGPRKILTRKADLEALLKPIPTAS